MLSKLHGRFHPNSAQRQRLPSALSGLSKCAFHKSKIADDRHLKNRRKIVISRQPLGLFGKFGMFMHNGPLDFIDQKLCKSKNLTRRTDFLLTLSAVKMNTENTNKISKFLVTAEIEVLKFGNKTANINIKKLQFIHYVSGNRSKTAKIKKGDITH